jgi:predicted ATPase/DNA-binding SARP family transcriptional activator
MTLHLHALGTFTVEADGKPLTDQLPRKAVALLVVLATSGKPHRRDTLAELLWPDQPPERASGSLRALLTDLRKDLAPYLTITRQSVALAETSPLWFDVTEFVRETEQFQRARSQSDTLPDERYLALEKALELVRGEFLAGFHLPNNNEFDQWLAEQREWLRRRTLQGGLELVAALRGRGDTARAIQWAQRLIHADPFHEEAHQHLMRALAESGARAAALEHYEKLRAQLRTELDVEPDAVTVALHQAIRTGQFPDTPKIRMPSLSEAVTPAAVRLPPQHHPFIGRGNELAQIETLLRVESCRLLTLIGMGGIGKTRLALEAARQLAEHYPDGAYFIPLAPVNDAAVIPATIAETIAIPQPGRNDIRQHLFNYLAGKSLLLVLDNFEHVVAGSPLVSEILQHAPQVCIIVTSRERLGLLEEWTLPIEGMPFPSPGTERQHPEHYQALEMFLQAARRTRPGFTLEPELDAVARICQLVQGVPLGIELAAAWVRVLSPAEIVRHIEQSGDFLTSTLRNIPERHRSMRAVFEWSWNLLSPNERDLLRRLAIFRGGFTLPAAQHVSEFPGLAIVLLSSLVEKSLVHYQENDARYTLHELLRQFAEEKLQADPSLFAAVEASHSRYYASFMKEREDRLGGAVHHDTIRETVRELDNIRAAWRYSVSQCDPDLILMFLRALYHLADGQNLYVECEAMFHAASDCLRGIDPGQTRLVTIRAGVYRGFYLHLLANYPEARAIFEDALPRLRSIIEREESAKWDLRLMLGYMAAMFYAQGDFIQSRHHYEAMVEMYRQMGQLDKAGEPVMRLSEIAVVLGEYQYARQIIQEHLPLFWNASSRRSQVLFLITLGDIDCKLGAFAEARGYFEEALTLCRQINYRINAGLSVWGVSPMGWAITRRPKRTSSKAC